MISSSIDLPEIPGLLIRSHAGREDVAAMLALHEACRVRDRIDLDSICYKTPNLSVERYAAEVEAGPEKAAVLVAESEGGPLLAHGWMEAWGIEERLYLWQVWVHPEWRGRGIGTALLHWGERRARELHGDDPRLALHLANATEGEADAVELLRNEGYALNFVSPELSFDVLDAVQVPRVVEGIELRSLGAEEHRAVARALSEANLNSPGQEARWVGEALEQRIDAEEDEWLKRVANSDPALGVVAWAGDEVAGAYLCGRSGKVGEIAQVAVRAPWRGRGVARALAMQSLRGLRSAGCSGARLFTSIGPDEVEPTEGPYAMYRKFGFVPIARHLRFRKAMS